MLHRRLPSALLTLCLATAPLTGQEVSEISSAFSHALAEANAAIADGEPQIAESRFRTALLEGWLLLGAVDRAAGEIAAARRAFEEAAAMSVELRRPRMALAAIELQSGDLERAILLLRRIVGADSGDLEARRLLAQALGLAGRTDLAIQELEELAALAPEDLEISYLLATAYLQQDELDPAVELLDALAAERPRAATFVLIGRTYRDYDFYDRARAALEHALALDPRARRAHFYLATVDLLEYAQARMARAIEYLRAELEIAPDDPMANLYLGMALAEDRRPEEAAGPLERAARHAATRKEALQYLGRTYLALDRPSDAVEVLREALELAQSVDPTTTTGRQERRESQLSSLHYQLALALRRIGEEEAAAPHFEAAQKHSARMTESSRESLARYLEDDVERSAADPSTGTPEAAALSSLDQSALLDLQDRLEHAVAETYLNLGVLQTRRGRFAKAADLFARAAQIEPDLPRVGAALGTALFNAGEYERALEPLERAHRADSSNDSLRRMLALARLHTDDYEEAIALLRDDPERATDRSLQYAYGLALVRGGRAEEAEAVFTRLLTENADWPELNVVLGQAHAQQQDYETAIAYLERALRLRPDVAEAHATLGDLYLRQGRLDDAERELRAELEIRPEDDRARYTLAVVLDLANRTEQALDLVRGLLARRPSFADAHYLAGKILLEQGSAEEALGHLRAAERLAPADANVHYQLGLTYQRLGRSEEAKGSFDTFRRLKDNRRSRPESP